MATSVQLGTASVNITPSVGTWMGGYGARTKPAEDIHDDLFAKALVFDDGTARAALVTVDVVGLSRESVAAVRRLVEQSTDVPGNHVMVACSHTHSGPLTRDWGYETPVNLEYMRELERKLAGAVQMARRRLRPVRLGLGVGSFSLAINRRLLVDGKTQMRPNSAGVVDHSVPVVRFDGEDGSPVAVLFQYACHATSMGAQNYAFSADYPGAARAFVERAYGGELTAAFTLGCCGDIRPHFTDEQGRFRSATFVELESVGRALGAEVVKAREGIHTLPVGNIAVTSRTVTMPLQELPTRAFLEQAMATGTWPDTGDTLSQGQKNWAARVLRLLESGSPPPTIPCEIQVIRIGSIVLASFPGEIFLEYGLQVRDRVKAETGLDVIHVELANDSIGYVPTAREIPKGGYEVYAYRHGAVAPTGYAGEAEPLLVNTAVDLVKSVAG